MKKQRGMTIFIAVVIMSLLLFISFAMVNITLKGTLFASSGRDSQYAFYAADAGMECAVYWDSMFEPSKFATSTSGSSITCALNTITTGGTMYGTTTAALIGGGGNANATSTFSFVMNQGADPVNYCAVVTVSKYYVGSVLKTYIKSRGYNTCDTSSLRRVERGVEVTY
jgi:hypothetical protein